jgi:hypothetical protein
VLPLLGFRAVAHDFSKASQTILSNSDENDAFFGSERGCRVLGTLEANLGVRRKAFSRAYHAVNLG